MSNSLYVYVAVLCAMVLPYFWKKASDIKSRRETLFFLATCLTNGILVLAVILVITTR